jgi:hypothetical protein
VLSTCSLNQVCITGGFPTDPTRRNAANGSGSLGHNSTHEPCVKHSCCFLWDHDYWLRDSLVEFGLRGWDSPDSWTKWKANVSWGNQMRILESIRIAKERGSSWVSWSWCTWFFVHSQPSELVSAVSGSLKSISIACSIAEASLHAYQVSTSSKVYANTYADSVSAQSWKLLATGVWITSSRVTSICIAGNRWLRSFKTRFLRTSCSMLACLYAIEMVRIY